MTAQVPTSEQLGTRRKDESLRGLLRLMLFMWQKWRVSTDSECLEYVAGPDTGALCWLPG